MYFYTLGFGHNDKTYAKHTCLYQFVITSFVSIYTLLQTLKFQTRFTNFIFMYFLNQLDSPLNSLFDNLLLG